jgi:ATP-dependent DNA helicase RecG
MNLDSKVTEIKSISTKSADLLSKLEIFNIRDLLTYFPVRYLDTSTQSSIRDLILNDNIDDSSLLKAKLVEFKSNFIRGGKSIQAGIIEDVTGSIKVSWFNQTFLKRALQVDNEYYFYGKLKKKGDRYSFYPQTFEKVTVDKQSIHLGGIIPEYRLINGVSKKTFRRWMHNCIESLATIEIENELEELGVEINLKDSLKNIHFPNDYETLDKSLQELSVAELTSIFLRMLKKAEVKKGAKPPTVTTSFNPDNIFTLLKNLTPFNLTDDQESIILNFLKEIKSGKLINQIIQGDVGSGKTIIAIAACLAMATNGYQSVVLTPTTILAKQHYNTFKSILDKLNISIELVTSEAKSKNTGQILIGTSAVLARRKNIVKKLGLVIVDEQHKFGVEQREQLLKPLDLDTNEFYPHFINMTATPIPRTISQIIFDDVELKTINTKPIGRLPIKTLVVPEQKRLDSYQWIMDFLKKGQQAYWICPLILESDKLQVKSAEKTYQEIKEYFKDFKVGILHGKKKNEDKLLVMKEFKEKQIDILVSTSVIEVGVDVANATIMVIENSERFGLAQLHQMRGRVGRGEKQSWCLLFYSKNSTEIGLNKLKFMSENLNGMEIAEYDLKNRGPGEIYGVLQSGIPDLKIAKIWNKETVSQAKKYSQILWSKKIKEINLFK